jgi:hypothetical protein
MGTYWPFLASTAISADDVSKELYNRLLTFCKKSHPQDPDTIKYVQAFMLQWMANAWQEGCCGQIARRLYTAWHGTAVAMGGTARLVCFGGQAFAGEALNTTAANQAQESRPSTTCRQAAIAIRIRPAAPPIDRSFRHGR